MTASDRAPATPPEGPLADLPLRLAAVDPWIASSPPARIDAGLAPAAPLFPRATAFAADAAVTLFTTAAALLAATRMADTTLGLAAVGWSAAFALYLSFFATVVPLAFFGRTLGMALAGLSAGIARAGRRLTLGEAVRRWLGTLSTAATFGLALLWRRGSARMRTPADRLSGRPLVEDGMGN